MTPADMAREGRRLSQLLEATEELQKEQIYKAAEAERSYRKARSQAWVRVPDGTAKSKQDWVDGTTADARFERDVATGLERAARESMQNRRVQISLLQSVANAHKADAINDRFGIEAA